MTTNSVRSEPRPLTVALVGNPNTGKSTLFNSLTGMCARIGNFPGVTVEKKIGRLRWNGQSIQVIDLPGTYSLSPRTLDEMISVDVLLGRQKDVGPIDAVVCILDASNLERNLYLASQVLDFGLPTVLVLNMCDVADDRGIQIDAPALEGRLGVRVVKTIAHRKQGLDEAMNAIVESLQRQRPSDCKPFPGEFYRACEQLRDALGTLGAGQIPDCLVARMVLDVGGHIESHYQQQLGDGLAAKIQETREQLAAAGLHIPAAEAKVRYRWIRQVVNGIVQSPLRSPVTLSDKIDKILTHRFAGMIFFAVLMLIVFQAIYTWSNPFMNVFESAQNGISNLLRHSMSPGALRSLLIDGVVAGVGGVLIFLPQIAFLFFFIAVLEDCGYMARAAFLMDKLMTRIGLSGKSFVPLMSSFACAVPGIMATRVIENRRDRMVTILVAPLMSCSARLPIYLLLIGAFIPARSYLGGWLALQGLVLFAMISLGAVVAIPVAWLAKKVVFRGETPPFVMELPSYKWPSPRIVLNRVWDRCQAFVTRAGTLICAATIVVWAAGYFPGDHEELDRVTAEIERIEAESVVPNGSAPSTNALIMRRNQLSGQLIEGSMLGHLGHTIEPVVRPLGWDWRIGIGVLASFPAREVIIATLGTIYSLGGDVADDDTGLQTAIQHARWPDGRSVFTIPVALSLMVFFALCAQCASTLMVIRRETNSWIWPLVTFAYMTALAFVAAFVTYQLGMYWA